MDALLVCGFSCVSWLTEKCQSTHFVFYRLSLLLSVSLSPQARSFSHTHTHSTLSFVQAFPELITCKHAVVDNSPQPSTFSDSLADLHTKRRQKTKAVSRCKLSRTRKAIAASMARPQQRQPRHRRWWESSGARAGVHPPERAPTSTPWSHHSTTICGALLTAAAGTAPKNHRDACFCFQS